MYLKLRSWSFLLGYHSLFILIACCCIFNLKNMLLLFIRNCVHLLVFIILAWIHFYNVRYCIHWRTCSFPSIKIWTNSQMEAKKSVFLISGTCSIFAHIFYLKMSWKFDFSVINETLNQKISYLKNKKNLQNIQNLFSYKYEFFPLVAETCNWLKIIFDFIFFSSTSFSLFDSNQTTLIDFWLHSFRFIAWNTESLIWKIFMKYSQTIPFSELHLFESSKISFFQRMTFPMSAAPKTWKSSKIR